MALFEVKSHLTKFLTSCIVMLPAKPKENKCVLLFSTQGPYSMSYLKLFLKCLDHQGLSKCYLSPLKNMSSSVFSILLLLIVTGHTSM